MSHGHLDVDISTDKFLFPISGKDLAATDVESLDRVRLEDVVTDEVLERGLCTVALARPRLQGPFNFFVCTMYQSRSSDYRIVVCRTFFQVSENLQVFHSRIVFLPHVVFVVPLLDLFTLVKM